jgi:hypothetical protein
VNVITNRRSGASIRALDSRKSRLKGRLSESHGMEEVMGQNPIRAVISRISNIPCSKKGTDILQ